MSLFWLGVALASLLAVALVLLPLRRARREPAVRPPARRGDNLAAFRAREGELAADLEAGRIDADTHAAMHADLARQLLADTREPDAALPTGRDWRAPVLASLLVPLLALAIYVPRGALQDVALAAEVSRAQNAAGGAAGAAQAADDAAHGDAETRALMVRLQERLTAQPDDTDGWFLLGRTALSVGAFPVAVQAFDRLHELVPDEPAVRIYQLQARYLVDNRQETDRVRELAAAVLADNPNEPITREILAMAAFQRGEFRAVLEHLQAALRGGVDEERRAFLEQGLAVARERLGLPPDADLAAGGSVDTVGPGAAGTPADSYIEVNVGVQADLAQRFAADTTVFVLARPPGGRMPLAVVRRTLADLPMQLRLDDSMAMSPAMTLSSVPAAEVVVRISPGGSAMRGDDDVELVARDVATNGSRVDLQLGSSTPPRVQAAAPRPAPTVATSEPTATPAVAAIAAIAAADQPGISVRVLIELAPELSTGLSPDTTVFVFAREVDGPPAPLAARRLRVADLPALITLTEADAMLPQRTLADVERVRIGARVSRGGGVTALPGDLEGASASFVAASVGRVVPVVIDRRVGS